MKLCEIEQQQILELLAQEIVPATGCTEPVAVALTTAHAAALLQEKDPTKWKQISLSLSANIIKNALGVGIPGTGMIGLPIAIALGAVIAQPNKQLTILNSFTNEQLATAKKIVDSPLITLAQEKEDKDPLYISVTITCQSGETATAVIAKTHTHLVSLLHNGEEQPVSHAETANNRADQTTPKSEPIKLSFDKVYNFALYSPLEKLLFIEEAAEMNLNAAALSLQGSYGHSLGKIVASKRGNKMVGETPLAKMLSVTCAACDARMDGATCSVMSNSGSGNQGLATTLPVAVFAKEHQASREETVRAVMLSNLMVVYIKQQLGRLSGLCGVVVAAAGVASALTYLMGGSKEQIAYAIQNVAGSLTGMICDGAKPGCSLKVYNGVNAAMMAALLAMEDQFVTKNEGIVDQCVDKTIEYLTRIGRVGMQQTDLMVLDIMTSKQ